MGSLGRQSVDRQFPLISVVLPIYNGEKYLAEAIESVISQTFADFELIMIDDGSTDGSRKILQEYAAKDLRVKVVLRENRGLATTLNDSIDIAHGSWIARMDQDDIALPHRFQRQLEWLEKTGADISGSWVQRFGTADKRIVRLPRTDEEIKMELLFCSPFAHPAVMMRTSLARGLRYDKAWEMAEDYDFWERAAEAGWRMTNVPEVLLMYRVHAAQISTLSNDRQQRHGYEISRRYWSFMFRSMRLDETTVNETLRVIWPLCAGSNMDAMDASFRELLRHSCGTARKLVFSHATRVYLRVAATCPDVVYRWNKLNREFGQSRGTFTRFRLRLLRLFRVRGGGRLFRLLRKIYVWKASL